METKTNKKFIITKKVAKHGNQSIIVIPRLLEQHLKPGTVTQLTIEILHNHNDEMQELKEETQ